MSSLEPCKDHYMTPGVFLGPRDQSGCTLGVSRSISFGTFYIVSAVHECSTQPCIR